MPYRHLGEMVLFWEALSGKRFVGGYYIYIYYVLCQHLEYSVVCLVLYPGLSCVQMVMASWRERHC